MAKVKQPEEQGAFKPGGLYAQFTTDPVLEAEGVEIDYGHSLITIARAGGSNKRFARIMEVKTKPHRRAIATETINPDRAGEILMEAYAETVILNWQSKVDGEWKDGIENPKGGAPLPATVPNIVAALTALPELFADLQIQATRIALFRETILEDDAGN